MRCEDALERLVEGLTGSVPPSEREAVVAHLRTCPRCRDEAERLESVVQQLRAAGEFSPPPEFWPAFMRRLERRLADERVPAWVRVRRWMAQPRFAFAAAAATAAVAVLISTAVRVGPRPGEAPDPLRQEARGLVTETMAITVPSLGEMLEVMRAGFAAEADAVPDATERRSP